MTHQLTTFMTKVSARPNPVTARLLINGLGLLCFSQKYNRAEVGFLEGGRAHPLFFYIYDRYCRLVGEPIPIPQGTEIDINAGNPGLGSIFCFDEANPPVDQDDFRHLINVDELHSAVPVKIVPNPTYFAKLYVNRGTFFNSELSMGKGRFFNKQMIEVKVKDRNGRIIGADIVDDPIRIDFNGNPIATLVRNPNEFPYSIRIRYKCEGDVTTATDFKEFYKVLNVPTADQLDFIYDAAEDPPKNRCDCTLLYRAETDHEFQKEIEKSKPLSLLVESLRRATEACEGGGKPQCPENLRGETEPGQPCP